MSPPGEAPAPPPDVVAQVRAALTEDIGSGDLTAALVPAAQRARATLVSREAAVLCGRPWFEQVFRELDPGITVTWQAAEGAALGARSTVCTLEGPARALLTGERTALNFLQTLSATATATRRYVEAVADTPVRILDTRKTIPGLRLAQKYAVRVGGATNHRIGLWDAILVKENHIVAAGSITAAVRTARERSPGVLLQVEVETVEQAAEAFAAGADRLLLDNFPLARLRAAVELRAARAPRTGLEASGGITLDNIREVAATGVDFISIGDITKNLHAVDLSLRFTFAGGH
ncbi:MAG: carboxylating nicotinate-nucleotide diphosphorylase [Gammaproteobacteria bacterium]|nr:carboxylating nicotinate-nucleotide diphosphorylase [Gammaproteobacteria bacterium]